MNLEQPFLRLTADRVLDELRRQEHVTLEGLPHHAAGPRAAIGHAGRAGTGADLDWIVAGAVPMTSVNGLAPQNHDRMSAEGAAPLRALGMWPGVVEHHGIFQDGSYYRAITTAGNRNARERFPRFTPVSTIARNFLRTLGPVELRPRLRHPAAGAFRADSCARSSGGKAHDPRGDPRGVCVGATGVSAGRILFPRN